jgi:hypothetical protein
VALAAGHRPCFFCRRRDAEAFRAAWENARGGKALWRRRRMRYCTKEWLDRGLKRIHPIPGPVGELPDGAVIAAAGQAYTIAHGWPFRWTEQGYQAARQIPHADGLLTPPSTLLAIGAGYRPALHPDLENTHF